MDNVIHASFGSKPLQVSDNPISRVMEASDRWDHAAEALRRRDYEGFDRLLGKSRETFNPFDGGLDAA